MKNRCKIKKRAMIGTLETTIEAKIRFQLWEYSPTKP
jgi:hypothetical protein